MTTTPTKTKSKYPRVDNRFFTEVIRPLVLQRDGNKCVKCGATGRLDISHNSYDKSIGVNDLETLCRNCHRKKDSEFKIYKKNFLQ